jgi:hypothetical protein
MAIFFTIARCLNFILLNANVFAPFIPINSDFLIKIYSLMVIVQLMTNEYFCA